MHRLLIILVIVLSACKSQEEKKGVFLEINLSESSNFLTEMEMTQDLEVSLNGVSSIVEQYFQFEIQTELQEIENGKKISSQNQYQRIVMQQQIENDAEQIIYYMDTDDPETAELPIQGLLDYYLQLTKIPYTFILDAQGNISSSNLNEVNQKAGGAQFSSPFQGLLSYGVIFPGYELQQNDTWEKEINFRDSLVTASGLLNYKLLSYNDKEAVISMKGKIKSNLKGMDAAGRMELEQEGTFKVYIKSGWVKSAEIQQKIKYTDPRDPSDVKFIDSQINIKTKETK